MVERVERHAHGHIIWARKPFHGRRGVYTAVRLRNNLLSIAIRRAGHLEWVPAAWGLTEAEAAVWAREGFSPTDW